MLTVLIVDDNVSFRAQAARLCAAEGFTTVSAGSLSELANVLTMSTPDLALVDIELPQIPGHRLGALIRSRQNIPIVLVSALDEGHVRRLFEASDADGWICKPLTRDKLIGAVTRFVVARKRRTEAVDEPVASETSAPATPRVLLVEDEPMISDRIESALASTCSVTCVTDGDTAIQRLVSGQYDCVLLDLMLPHLSGFDVLRHLVLRRGDLLKRTIVMTAATDESLQFIDRNAVGGVLRKPFEIGTLPELIANLTRA
ncbi:MAG TPA: response regulator [Thermoanaerobaculia bacterium]|jgi:CheY-like chemotaxis protein|nr:response regulator [Thermoanaerobaculia bacterium]